MNFTITIAREYGSGGRYIATKVAELLNIAFYDKELLQEEAKKLGVKGSMINTFDEDESKGFYFPSITAGADGFQAFSQASYMATLKTIQLIASNQSSVIVGRCADYILQDDSESVLKVFIYAPIDSKVKRAQTYLKAPKSKEETKKLILKKDKQRKRYYEFITDKDWGNPLEYDILINSDLGIDAAASAIVEAAKKKFNIK